MLDSNAGGSTQANECDVCEEMPSGGSDLEDESRNLVDEEELPDSSKVKTYFSFSCCHS